MEFIKLFEKHSDYEAFVSGGTMVRPNVSHCITENEVHYGPLLVRLTAKIMAQPLTSDFIITNMSNYIPQDLNPVGPIIEGPGETRGLRTAVRGNASVDTFFPDSINCCNVNQNPPYFYLFRQADDNILYTGISEFLTFNESYYEYSENSILLDTEGNILKIKKEGEEMIDDNDNYITTDVIPMADENGRMVYDEENDTPIFYNGKVKWQRYVKILNSNWINQYDNNTYDADGDTITNLNTIKIDGTGINLNAFRELAGEESVEGNLAMLGYFPMDNAEHTIEYMFDSKDKIIGNWLASCNCLREVEVSSSAKKISHYLIGNDELIGTREEVLVKIFNNTEFIPPIEATFAGENIGDMNGFAVIDGVVVKKKCSISNSGIGGGGTVIS